MKLFIILFFLSFTTYASTLNIDYGDTKFESFEIEYLKDSESSYKLNDVKNMNFKSISNQNAFGGKVGSIWYRLHINNTTNVEKTIFLHNNFAYYSKETSIYLFNKNHLLDQNRFNILRGNSIEHLVGSAMRYPLTIKSMQEITIYIKNTPMVNSLFNLRVYDKKRSLNAITNGTFYSNIIIFIVATLAFYNLMLYIFNRRKEFMFYSFYLLNAALGFFYMYGSVFNHFHLYGESLYWFNLTAILVSLFLALFIKYTFETSKIGKKVDLLLNSLIALVILNLLVAIFIDLSLSIELLKGLFVYSFLIIIYFAFVLFKNGHHLAKLFILAYAIYIIGMTITLLAMSNLIALNFFTFHASGISFILEALLFSYLINNQFHSLEKTIREQREVIISKNKKAQLGDMISAIAHQWKQPLSRISSITSLLDFKLINKQEITDDRLSKKITQINSNVKFLSETIDDFKDFFNPNNLEEKCDISDIVNRAIALSKDDTLTKQIEIKTDLSFGSKVNIYKNELLHIILNIIQNSKEAFKDSSGDIKLIKIIGYKKDDKIHIDIIDNAGGISEETLPFIFNEHYTTKEKKSGSGLGLYLTKVILEDHLKGSIEAKNTEDGAMFRIII